MGFWAGVLAGVLGVFVFLGVILIIELFGRDI